MPTTSSLIDFRPGESAAAAHAALKAAVLAMENAEHRAVMWFGEMMRRKLYRELGYSSINQYAALELKFSRTKTGDFIRLAGKLDDLPVLRESVRRGEISYTKAREIVKVATAKTEQAWLAEAAGSSRRELERKVSHARRQARQTRRVNSDQTELLPAADVPETAVEIPVRVGLEMSAEQFARYEALWERLHKLGEVPAGRAKAEVVLEAMAALVMSLDRDHGSAPRGGASSARRMAPVMTMLPATAETNSMPVPPSRSTSTSVPSASGPACRRVAGSCRAARPISLVRSATRGSSSRASGTRRPSRRRSGARCWRAIVFAARRRVVRIHGFSRFTI